MLNIYVYYGMYTPANKIHANPLPPAEVHIHVSDVYTNGARFSYISQGHEACSDVKQTQKRQPNMYNVSIQTLPSCRP